MAEAVAVVGVLASILQLVEYSLKFLDRLNDFVTSTRDVPEAFRNISLQLPLTIATLQRLASRIEGNELTANELKALQGIVDRSKELVQEINGILSKTVPSKNSSSLEKRLLAIRSLRHDQRIQNATAQLLQNVNLVTFFQTTQMHETTADLAQRLSTTTLSDVPQATNFRHGLNLGGAPHLAEGNFVGRELELDQLSDMLKPGSQRQSVVAVVGMGGIGKTQLCIEHAVTKQDLYSSIFWLNAQDETSFRADLLNVAEIVLSDQPSMMIAGNDDETAIQKLRRWFSHPENRSWLLIFDNLDNPKVSGDNDPSSLDVREYFPYRSQGSILITTRSRKITFAKQLPLRKLETLEQGLKILSVRSGQTYTGDNAAVELVRRLDGLPLALTSAASFLERTSCTVQEYLDEYERNWFEDDSESLFEYGDRTLFTTWNMSVAKLKQQDAHAAELLRISAFFGNENTYYNLLTARDSKLWPGLGDMLRTKAGFDRSMAKLRDYSLIETSSRSYRLHPCVHDWTLSGLNQQIEESDIWRAVACITAESESSSLIWSADWDESQSRLASHAIRLMHPRLYDVLTKSELDEWRSADLSGLGQLLHRAGRIEEAVPIITRVLTWSQQHLGEEHQVFLYACNALGLIQQELQNFSEAESLLKQAVHGFAQTLGQHHENTLDPVHNLALLYTQLDRFEEAEKMYLWSLRGCEESYGPQDANTFWATMAIANFYMEKNEHDEAERQFLRALEGFDAAIDKDHFFSRLTAGRLGAIYEQRGDYNSAAAMFQRVYESCRRLFGPDHWSTLEARDNLSRLRVKSLLETSSGTPSTSAEALSVPPLDRIDLEAPRSPETAVNSDDSLQDVNAGNLSDIIPKSSNPGPL